MTNSNKKKYEQLGMPAGTAMARLKKNILFSLVQECGKDTCYRCGKKIEDVVNFSIEHKKPWQNSDTPKELFYDLNNIAFSHMNCNYGAASKNVDELREISREAFRQCKRHSKFSEADIIKIRELLKTKKQIEIARMYGVSKHAISKIANNKTFSYIQ